MLIYDREMNNEWKLINFLILTFNSAEYSRNNFAYSADFEEAV